MNLRTLWATCVLYEQPNCCSGVLFLLISSWTAAAEHNPELFCWIRKKINMHCPRSRDSEAYVKRHTLAGPTSDYNVGQNTLLQFIVCKGNERGECKLPFLAYSVHAAGLSTLRTIQYITRQMR